MPIPIPINEVTGVIAVAVIGLTYMFRKRLWRKATNWINGEKFFQTDLPWYAEDIIFIASGTIVGVTLGSRDLWRVTKRLRRRAKIWNKRRILDAYSNSDK